MIDRASNEQAGLDLATAVEYDLILLDVQIPQLDGTMSATAIARLPQINSNADRKLF